VRRETLERGCGNASDMVRFFTREIPRQGGDSHGLIPRKQGDRAPTQCREEALVSATQEGVNSKGRFAKHHALGEGEGSLFDREELTENNRSKGENAEETVVNGKARERCKKTKEYRGLGDSSKASAWE